MPPPPSLLVVVAKVEVLGLQTADDDDEEEKGRGKSDAEEVRRWEEALDLDILDKLEIVAAVKDGGVNTTALGEEETALMISDTMTGEEDARRCPRCPPELCVLALLMRRIRMFTSSSSTLTTRSWIGKSLSTADATTVRAGELGLDPLLS